MKKYFIVDGIRRLGPFDENDLLLNNITFETIIWTFEEGEKKAGEYAELQNILQSKTNIEQPKQNSTQQTDQELLKKYEELKNQSSHNKKYDSQNKKEPDKHEKQKDKKNELSQLQNFNDNLINEQANKKEELKNNPLTTLPIDEQKKQEVENNDYKNQNLEKDTFNENDDKQILKDINNYEETKKETERPIENKTFINSQINQQQNNSQYNNSNQSNFTQSSASTTPQTYLFLSILSTLLCCLPLGIFAIIYSNKAKTAYSQGFESTGKQYASTALMMNIISIIGGVIFWIIIASIQK